MAGAAGQDGKLNVFISYSRDDLEFADVVDAALRLAKFETTIDRHGTSPGEDWRKRLGGFILAADTVVFVLSPSSAEFDICLWEVGEAVRLGKRIIPVVCRPLEGKKPPKELADRDYIFCYPEPKSPGAGVRSWASRTRLGAQYRFRLAARAHEVSAARDRVGCGRSNGKPASVRRRHRLGQGLGGAQTQNGPRADRIAARIHQGERGRGWPPGEHRGAAAQRHSGGAGRA